MGALRFNEDVDEILEKDPYELFQIDAPDRTVRSWSPGALRAAGLGAFVASLLAAFTFWHAKRQGIEGVDVPYAYFEVKAIDPDGRPVAGATVKEGGKIVGVTDSFGEWRRFMPVTPGATVMLELSKKTLTGTLTAVKNLAVPPALPKSGDLELSGSVALQRAADDEQAPKQKRSTGAGLAQKPSADAGGSVEAQAPGPTGSIPDPSSDSTRVAAYQGLALPASLDFTKVALFADPRGFQPLGDVAQAIRRRVTDLGIAVDQESPFHIDCRDLRAGDDAAVDAHLIQVEGILAPNGGEPKVLFTFLRNYQSDVAATARDVLWAVSVETPVRHWVERRDRDWLVKPASARLWDLSPGRLLSTEAGRLISVIAAAGAQDSLRLVPDGDAPCPSAATRCALVVPGVAQVPPVAGWTRLNFKVVGPTDGVTLYATGFQATPDEGHLYSYWGRPSGGVNITAVRDGRIVFRSHLASPARGQILSFSLPSAPLSKR